MTTIRDVAKISGYSVATVSRVINQSGYVSKDAEEKIREYMKKLNFSPNSLARGLASKKTNTIALILPDITNPFFPELARAVEDTAKKFGYSLILCNSDGNGEEEVEYIKNLKNRYVDGVIIASHQLETSEIKELSHCGIPIVALDRAVHSSGVLSIRVNNFQGAILATKHLVSIGCRKIAFISGPVYWNTSMERYQGFYDTLNNEDIFNPSYIKQGDFSMESGQKLTHQLIIEHPEIDGIFAANDLMAIGALKALIRLGKKIPDEVALIGFDGITISNMIEPEISTVAQPIYQMGERSVHHLIKQFENPNQLIEGVEVLGTHLIQRASTKRM